MGDTGLIEDWFFAADMQFGGINFRILPEHVMKVKKAPGLPDELWSSYLDIVVICMPELDRKEA